MYVGGQESWALGWHLEFALGWASAAWAQISRQGTQLISQTGEEAAFILMGTQEVTSLGCKLPPALWPLSLLSSS